MDVKGTVRQQVSKAPCKVWMQKNYKNAAKMQFACSVALAYSVVSEIQL